MIRGECVLILMLHDLVETPLALEEESRGTHLLPLSPIGNWSPLAVFTLDRAEVQLGIGLWNA